MPTYPRKEIEAMIERWLEANRDSERAGDWVKSLGKMYTENAEYSWNMGPNREFIARGRREIEEWALGAHMEGFEKWRYPYDTLLIDEVKGEVIGIWRQVAPVKRDDGTEYEVSGLGGSWFRYGGNYQWAWQKDFFDLGNVKALFFELAADGKLEPPVKQKLRRLAWGLKLPGVYPIQADPSVWLKLQGLLAMIRIVLFGR
jgi:hypothetical protein